MLWHYLGVVLVCLPWWAWVWSNNGEVYLVGRLPGTLQVPLAVAAVVSLIAVTAAFVSGVVDRFLAGERRRRWAGWIVAVVWTAALFELLLITGSAALARSSSETLKAYIGQLIAPAIVIVPLLTIIVGYVVFKAMRVGSPWQVFALALLFQTPVCALIVVEGWGWRQLLVLQTLLLCALAAFIADAGRAALKRSGGPALMGATAVAVSAVLLLSSAGMRMQAQLFESPGGLSEGGAGVPEALAMTDWMAGNVPEGESILVNSAQANYLAFLDGGRHRWAELQLDQKVCVPRPNAQIGCDISQNYISKTPPNTVWFQMKGFGMEGACRAISLSMPNLMQQVRREGSGYVVLSGSPKYPGLLELPSRLKDSGAFEVANSELTRKGTVGAEGGVILLKSTGRRPRPVPTQMDSYSAFLLQRCEQAKGPGYTERMLARFPNGIVVVPG